MERQEQVNFGERLFIMAVILVLIAEGIFTCLALATPISWGRLLLGLIGGALILILANAIYSGSRQGYQAALGWAALAIVLTVLPLAMPANFAGLGASLAWAAWFKLIAYCLFVLILFVPVSVQAFLASRRGEQVKVREKAVVDAGSPLAWTDEQNKAFASLTTSLLSAGGVLIVVGLLLLGLALGAPVSGTVDPFALLEAVTFLILGLILVMPVSAWQAVASSESGKGYLMKALSQLTVVAVVVILASLAAGLVVINRLLPLFK
jgi:hypothetical protein